jgi:hypothetical protein
MMTMTIRSLRCPGYRRRRRHHGPLSMATVRAQARARDVHHPYRVAMALSTKIVLLRLTPHSEAVGIVHLIHLLQNCHREGALQHRVRDDGTMTGTALSTINRHPNNVRPWARANI